MFGKRVMLSLVVTPGRLLTLCKTAIQWDASPAFRNGVLLFCSNTKHTTPYQSSHFPIFHVTCRHFHQCFFIFLGFFSWISQCIFGSHLVSYFSSVSFRFSILAVRHSSLFVKTPPLLFPFCCHAHEGRLVLLYW